MSRKKRRFEQLEAAASKPKEKVDYRDPFQEKVGTRVEEIGKRFEGQGRNILYAVGAVAVIAILIGIFYLWSSRSNAAGQAALAKAIETSQAAVSASPLPAGSTQKSFKSERERSEAAIAEFQSVAQKYGGSIGEKAKYFAAVNKLVVDRQAGEDDLRGLASSSSPAGKLAKYALAQALTGDGKYDDAVSLYQELAGMDDPVIAKDTVNFDLAQVYEKQGKKQEAADIYFNIAKAASEAKDQDGKPVPMTDTARQAKTKLEQLDPDRAKQITEPEPSSPFGE
jgi:tetratricopeptide (TPR) repeat protein